METLKHQIQELECNVQRLNAGIAPPLPPPPPPPPPSFNPIKSLITLISSGKKASTLAAVKKEAGNVQQQKAMSEMIDAIKKGSVHLRPTPKASVIPEISGGDSAVDEMKEILTSLKKQKTGASSLQSTSPEPVSNELLEKLEKRRKISVSSENVSPPLVTEVKDDEEQSTIELRVILKDKGTELILNDILQSSSSEDPGTQSGVMSTSDSQTEAESHACSPDGSVESPCPPVELRRKTLLSGAVDEMPNICRGTFLVDTNSGAVRSEVDAETNNVNDNCSIVSDHLSFDSENSECDIFSDEEKPCDENAQCEVSGRNSNVNAVELLNVNMESENVPNDLDASASVAVHSEGNSTFVEDTTSKECCDSEQRNEEYKVLCPSADESLGQIIVATDARASNGDIKVLIESAEVAECEANIRNFSEENTSVDLQANEADVTVLQDTNGTTST